MSLKLMDFFKNKNILLTGGTGFLGRACVEKILRAFPDIGHIYMIVRNKRGENLAERKNKFLDNQVFNRLKRENKVDFSKLVWIEGDLRHGNLGMSQETITELQESVNIIIHSAATINMAGSLKDAITMNVNATNDLLSIANGCKHLVGFMHISTLFCKARKSIQHIDEQIMKHPIEPNELIKLSNNHSKSELDAKTKEFILDWPNTYTYTKNAAENLVADFKGKFPIAIFRPGVVVNSYREPVPYWVDNMMAVSRVFNEINRGFVFESNPAANANAVPVDMTINAVLAALYETAMKKHFSIYNYTNNENPINWMHVNKMYTKAITDFHEVRVPYRKQLLEMKNVAPGSKEQKLIKEIRLFEMHHEKFLYFINKDLMCDSINIDNLCANYLSDEDRKLLPFDVRNADWDDFYGNMYEHSGDGSMENNPA